MVCIHHHTHSKPRQNGLIFLGESLLDASLIIAVCCCLNFVMFFREKYYIFFQQKKTLFSPKKCLKNINFHQFSHLLNHSLVFSSQFQFQTMIFYEPKREIRKQDYMSKIRYRVFLSSWLRNKVFF